MTSVKIILIFSFSFFNDAIGGDYAVISTFNGMEYRTYISHIDLKNTQEIKVTKKVPLTLPQISVLANNSFKKQFKGVDLFLHRITLQRMGHDQRWFYKVTYKSNDMMNSLNYIVTLQGKVIQPVAKSRKKNRR